MGVACRRGQTARERARGGGWLTGRNRSPPQSYDGLTQREGFCSRPSSGAESVERVVSVRLRHSELCPCTSPVFSLKTILHADLATLRTRRRRRFSGLDA